MNRKTSINEIWQNKKAKECLQHCQKQRKEDERQLLKKFRLIEHKKHKNTDPGTSTIHYKDMYNLPQEGKKT